MEYFPSCLTPFFCGISRRRRFLINGMRKAEKMLHCCFMIASRRCKSLFQLSLSSWQEEQKCIIQDRWMREEVVDVFIHIAPTFVPIPAANSNKFVNKLFPSPRRYYSTLRRSCENVLAGCNFCKARLMNLALWRDSLQLLIRALLIRRLINDSNGDGFIIEMAREVQDSLH